jgi:hypothetical protein
MKRKWIILIGLLVVAAMVLWWLRTPQPKQPRDQVTPIPEPIPSASPHAATTTSAVQSLDRTAVVESIQGALATPITFYGRVVDQNDDPVPDATVNYNALDKFDASGSQYQGKSDANGNFSISGIVGAALSVGVRKEGHYMIDGKSANTFAYGVGPDSVRREPPTKDDPAIFVLQKMGTAEPLIHISSRTYRIPRNGAPVEVNLTTGRVSAQGHLRVETWTEDQTKDAKQHYNWRCRISLPNGGLIERYGQFDFRAPADGYRPSDYIVMLRTAEKWQPQAKRNYFIQLPEGNYGRSEQDGEISIETATMTVTRLSRHNACSRILHASLIGGNPMLSPRDSGRATTHGTQRNACCWKRERKAKASWQRR